MNTSSKSFTKLVAAARKLGMAGTLTPPKGLARKLLRANAFRK